MLIMAIQNVLLTSQISFYVISLILSVCVIVPISLHQSQFRGHCLLFSSGTWQDTGQFSVQWSSPFNCNFPILVAVLSGIEAIVQIYQLSMFACNKTDSSFISAFMDVIRCSVLCILTFIASVIVTYGFMIWCKNMTERFPSCEIAAGNTIDEKDKIDTSEFYIQLGTAQFGVWALWVSSVGLTVCAVLKLCRYHQLQNMRVSMFRERQRLINEDTNQENSRPVAINT